MPDIGQLNNTKNVLKALETIDEELDLKIKVMQNIENGDGWEQDLVQRIKLKRGVKIGLANDKKKELQDQIKDAFQQDTNEMVKFALQSKMDSKIVSKVLEVYQQN